VAQAGMLYQWMLVLAFEKHCKSDGIKIHIIAIPHHSLIPNTIKKTPQLIHCDLEVILISLALSRAAFAIF
jgi:hypothetical protein